MTSHDARGAGAAVGVSGYRTMSADDHKRLQEINAELLAALKRLVDAIVDGTADDDAGMWYELPKARAAIAKAEGRKP